MARVLVIDFEARSTAEAARWKNGYSDDGYDMSFVDTPSSFNNLIGESMIGVDSAIATDGNYGYYDVALPAAMSSLYLKTTMKTMGSLYSSCLYLLFKDASGNNQAWLNYISSWIQGCFLFQYTGGNVATYPGYCLKKNTANIIELYFVPSTTNGTIIIKIDGITVLSASGVKTAVNNSPVAFIGLGDNGTGQSGIYCTDLIVDDSSWIGPTKIKRLLPTGAGATSGLSPVLGSGNNYEQVNGTRITDSKGKGLYGNVNGLYDTYALADFVETHESIKSVSVRSRAHLIGASPAVTRHAAVMRSGGSDYAGSSILAPELTPWEAAYLRETDPADSAAWTAAKVNSIEIGAKVIT